MEHARPSALVAVRGRRGRNHAWGARCNGACAACTQGHCVVRALERPPTLAYALQHYIEHRNEEYADQCGNEHPEDYSGAERFTRTGARACCDCEWNGAQDEGE